MKILLTGGSGFIGRHVLAGLSSGYQIAAPSSSELDVRDAQALEAFVVRGRFDAIVHAAIRGGDAVLEETLRGFWNVSWMAPKVSRIVYFGSGAEFGKHRDLDRVSEDEIGRETPRDPYGLAKLFCNAIARRCDNIVNLRLFGVYGAHEGYLFKFISNSVVKALLGEPITVRQNVRFDYLEAGDLVAMLPHFLEAPGLSGDFNATTDTPVALDEILAALAEVRGQPLDVRFETPGWNYAYTGSNAKLRSELPRLRFTTIGEGVARLHERYRARLPELDREAVARDDYRLGCRTRGESPGRPGGQEETTNAPALPRR